MAVTDDRVTDREGMDHGFFVAILLVSVILGEAWPPNAVDSSCIELLEGTVTDHDIAFDQNAARIMVLFVTLQLATGQVQSRLGQCCNQHEARLKLARVRLEGQLAVT